MSGRWWRAYGRARHDPKLLKLSDKDFRWWFNFVCVASDNDGKLPYVRDLAAEFRTTEHAISVAIERLRAAGLFDIEGEPGPDVRYTPHNWNGLQYKSDVSNERVKRYRERHCNVTGNVTVTPSETESDTESDTEQKKRPARRGERLPKDWSPTEEELKYAADQGCVDPKDTAERFKLHHWSKGTLGKDWHSGFQYWCRNEKNFKRAEPQKFNGSNNGKLPPEEPWEQRITGWVKARQWVPQLWGPAPGQAGCRAPPKIIHDVWETYRP